MEKQNFSTSSLHDLCLIKLIDELEQYSPELLSLLPPVDRKQLLLFCPVVSICHLEQTCAFDGIDSEIFWGELLEKHIQNFGALYDTTVRLEALRASYSSNREKFFAILTTMIFSGDRFSGHYGISEYYEEFERWKDDYADTVPTDEQHPDDIVNYLVAYRKPDAVNVKTMEPKHDRRSSSEEKKFYYALPVRDVFGLRPGMVYEFSTKGQHVHSHFSHYILKKNHYRLSDEDAIMLMMNECLYYPKRLLLRDYEVMQWVWSHDALLALLTEFFSKLESLSLWFRGCGKDLDDYIPGVRYDTEDLELVLKSCFSSPVLTSVEIFGEITAPRDLVLASTLGSKPCPSLSILEIRCLGLGVRFDTTSWFEALVNVITSHNNLSEFTLDLECRLGVSASSFSLLYTSLISFVQKQTFSKLIIRGLVPVQLRLLLNSFLKTPCSHSQQISLQSVQPQPIHNEATTTNLPISVTQFPINKVPSGALEYKSLFIDEICVLTTVFCEWLFSHQPLALKTFHFNAPCMTLASSRLQHWNTSTELAAPIHLLSDNTLFHIQELCLTLVSDLPDKAVESILHHQQLKKLSLIRSKHRYSTVSCSIGDVAKILSLQHETLTDLMISLPSVSIGSSANVKSFGDAISSLSNYQDFSLSVSVFWKKEDSKYIELLYKNWLKHGRKKMKLFQMGNFAHDFDLTEEMCRMLDEMGLKIQQSQNR